MRKGSMCLSCSRNRAIPREVSQRNERRIYRWSRGRSACCVLARSHRSRENQFRFGRGKREERNARETVVETGRGERWREREREEDVAGRKCRSTIFPRLTKRFFMSVGSLILRYAPLYFAICILYLWIYSDMYQDNFEKWRDVTLILRIKIVTNLLKKWKIDRSLAIKSISLLNVNIMFSRYV